MGIEKLIGDKRRWRAYKARVRALPPNYAHAVDAIERYLLNFGPSDGGDLTGMFEDLADLFEQAVADATPIRGIVGDDPVEFVEAFMDNYRTGGWVVKERQRLTDAIARAERAGGED